MSLLPRHRWCLEKILQCFEYEGLDDVTAQAFIRKADIISKFNALFSGNGHVSLFVHYQNKNTCHTTDIDTTQNPIRELFVSYGDSVFIVAKCCYFIRSGSSVDTSIGNDNSLLYGELSASPLHTFQTLLANVYWPTIENSNEWKQVLSDEQRHDFEIELDKFLKRLRHGLVRPRDGLELTLPPTIQLIKLDEENDTNDRDVTAIYSSVLEDWCVKIELLLSQYYDQNLGKITEKYDDGPKGEIDYWYDCMQHFSMIIEQSKRTQRKRVVETVLSLIKNCSNEGATTLSLLLRRWKKCEMDAIDALNEAKDNFKYLQTLERYVEPLGFGSTQTIIDILPALINSIKMIQSVARYYCGSKRITLLFSKITNQIILNCKRNVKDNNDQISLWDRDYQSLVDGLKLCLKLNDNYQEQYRLVQRKLQENPDGRQFDCNEVLIFGKMDLFCRRITKLIELFTTIDQFGLLTRNKLEGMGPLLNEFVQIKTELRSRNHDLLDFQNNKFDRDFVEFTVKISELESKLQRFVNDSFDRMTSITKSLNLLRTFQDIFQRDVLKADLDSKLGVLLQNYGLELEHVQHIYENQKHNPPFARNIPPVAGNIMWSRHLLKKIEEPMKLFESYKNVLSGKDAKRVVKMYNKVAKTLVAFEFLWFKSWVHSIDQAKAGLQATLIIRHPYDDKLYVNFDQEILQLIREAKCLHRINIDIPENARIILFQEEKFKRFYAQLSWALSEYDRIVSEVAPVTAIVLRPHFNDMEYKMRLGMTTLTWASMNIDAFIMHVLFGLHQLRDLVCSINDIIENRIEKNLKVVSKARLIDLPQNASFTVSDFLSIQRTHIMSRAVVLQNKNTEVESAVDDLVMQIKAYEFDSHNECINEDDIVKLKEHYNQFMYQALLHSAKNSMNSLKKRIGSRGTNIINSSRPIFEVNVQLIPPFVSLSPTLDDIQSCINQCAQTILSCYKDVIDWKHRQDDKEGCQIHSFFERITKDIELVRVALLLTGCIQGIRNTVSDYLNSFSKYDWLWKADKASRFTAFVGKNPTLDEYGAELRSFGDIQKEIDRLSSIHIIGALSLNTKSVKMHLGMDCDKWKIKYSENLHERAKTELDRLIEYIRSTGGKLHRKIDDLDSLRFIINILKEVRDKESSIEMEVNPIMDMYQLLELYLPPGFMDKEEIDKKTILRSSWKKVVAQSLTRADELSRTQSVFQSSLLRDIETLKFDVAQFYTDFIAYGPLVDGLTPFEAVDRLSRFKEELKIRERKLDLYRGGEVIFGLSPQEYPELEKARKVIKMSSQLFDLYTDVIRSLSDWKQTPWVKISSIVEEMNDSMDSYLMRLKKLPNKLREYESFNQLKVQIDVFQRYIPILRELSKESIKSRHWEEVMKICNQTFEIVGNPDFRLQELLEADLISFESELEEVTDGADKQLKIEQQLIDISSHWLEKEFAFQTWKERGIFILKGTSLVMEELEESQMNLQTMLTVRHVAPFRSDAQLWLGRLCETSETLERWLKVQLLWCGLESVFTGGDIAKQMPKEAKKFSKVDKAWEKIMSKASECRNVLECCSDELLRSSLPTMYGELEKCQKSLEGYLEQKQNAFPRFYFVSNAKLLLILSQGSDPLAMNEYYENVFDAIQFVEHDKNDKTSILKIHGSGGVGHEIVPFLKPVKAIGNVEDWLMTLQSNMKLTLKDLARSCAAGLVDVQTDLMRLRGLVDCNIAQFALLAIQLMWTYETQSALDQFHLKRNAMKDNSMRQHLVLSEMSSWCLQDLGTNVNRRKIETLVTVHVHQRDIAQELMQLSRTRRSMDASDFDWLKQARFYWRPTGRDDISIDGATVVSITDVDFNYQYEYLGSKERLVITPLTDKCYITLAQALGMYQGGAPAGPAGTGKTETVKDLGNTLGIFVVVTNCTDQMKYTDCAKIFKGLCQGGLWGCFDEFNRITLPVLSVVAQQVLAVQNAKKQGLDIFQFPGDPQNVRLESICAFFITMNPGYAGRQELPENLKVLFRGVAMMTPDFQIIKKVKMCSVGYADFDILSAKFFTLYATCKEQLSNQRHYDWGLRNILSVLRTMGATKRENLDTPENTLVYRTVRDMNLSKLVAQDVPLFLSLLADLFPGVAVPAKGEHQGEEAILSMIIEKHGLVHQESWMLKIIQLYETTKVRHGIMLVGPSGGGKSTILKCLKETLQEQKGTQYRDIRFNPKSMRAQEMYGETDILSGEWTTGVFAAIWTKYNNRNNLFNTWIIADGPVDAIWIEDLNTVLDDNKILTLANGDRIPMTDNVKMMFEVETLVNASPATVSRAGIIYVSDSDLDWAPVMESWIRKRPHKNWQNILRQLVSKWIGNCSATDPGHCFDFMARKTSEVMTDGRVSRIMRFTQLFQGLTENGEVMIFPTDNDGLTQIIERYFVYSLCWSVGSLLETDDRVKFDLWLRQIDSNKIMPSVDGDNTVYEYFIDPSTFDWKKWVPMKWTYPEGNRLNFSTLLVPTMDSTRANYVIKHVHKQQIPALIVGAEGTAKTSTILMYLSTQDPNRMLTKRINFSSATTPAMAQFAIESELDKRSGKNYGPPNAKKMTIFLDDISMPEVNKWGDQPTLELIRFAVEYGGFCFLDKDKRGELKTCEDLQYLAAMQHPGGGKNSIPNRMKRNFFIFNLVLPSITSINDIYGQMLQGRFCAATFDKTALDVVGKLTSATISLWKTIKSRMLPTPTKFHYVFNMRELSRVFQGILLTPTESIIDKGVASHMILALWKHECDRVFCDKLSSDRDIIAYEKMINQVGKEIFGGDMYDNACSKPKFMVSFLRDDVIDDDGMLIQEAPKIYEDGGSIDNVRARAYQFLARYNENHPSKRMDLVLFDDALKHLLRISRLIETPRGCGLLVGVGGSGKQSLTRLAAFISRSFCFQITLSKQYKLSSLMDDIRFLYKTAGHKRQSTTFIFTENEVKDEVFLEIINSMLITGEVPGLFAKDEILAMSADLRNDFLRERPGLDETPENLRQFFIDCVRDNLHIILCMSPLNPSFPIRARKFPGLISCPTVDWFLGWPEEALVSVSQGYLGDFDLDCSLETKENLIKHVGVVHKMVVDVCDDYRRVMKRQVYQTPKSYLSFLSAYKTMYSSKLSTLKDKESRVKLGLDKLIQGAQDVEAMKIVLATEQLKLEEATSNTNKMLDSLELSSAEAKREGSHVAGIKAKCEDDALRIGAEKASCANDLAKAQPFVEEANAAINSIKPAHIGEIKKLANPSDIIKLVFDCVLILFQAPLAKIQPSVINVAKKEIPWFEPSFKQALQVMSSPNFLSQLVEFGNTGKDLMNDETIEFLSVYLDIEQFSPAVAKNASVAAEGLCTYIRAMKSYHEASKVVKPKMEALAIAEGQMAAATKALAAAETRLAACNERLAELQNMFEAQMRKKRVIEEGATNLQKKMNQASELIQGLAGERARWTEDAANFNDQKMKLVGDCALGCAFVSYCGPFNQQFRQYLLQEKFTMDLLARGVPVSKNLDIVSFLVDVGTIGDWNIQGLPTDPLSIQNGILVTKSTRYPLLVDPQGQALSWIKNKEAENLPSWGGQSLVSISDPKLKEKLEFCMGNGRTLVLVGVENHIDHLLDPVLEKQYIVKGSKKFVIVGDKVMDCDPSFNMYFITRLPNPTFSPEIQAKTTLIDFTVTQKGLEEQLLGKVISREQKALEEQLHQVLEEVIRNTKSLMQLDASLLERLTSNSGDLLEDEQLINVLANTKLKAAEVKAKLMAADDTRSNIAEKREQFRPVATRGSILYFSIVEMSLVNFMYQTSLGQFLDIFIGAMDRAEKALLASKRVTNIIDTMTYMTYRYINRGLYEADKLTFVLLVALKILVGAQQLRPSDVSLFLRGGAALDSNNVKRKLFDWLSNEQWLNVIQLSESTKFYSTLIEEMKSNEGIWKMWLDNNEPEKQEIPTYGQKIREQVEIGPFLKLLLIRSLRVDRSILACKDFVRCTKELGPLYIEPVTDTIESTCGEMAADVPVLFLLSRGADPTENIETLCRKKKLPSPAIISLGEGQEPVALKAINAGIVNGTWVLLQNCELGLGLMNDLESIINKSKDIMDKNFRLFLTALPNPDFPLGLLHMCIKATNEPPSGLKAGLLRSYTPGVMVDQDRLERVDSVQWRQLLYALCFLHSVVQERRKFGPLGWCIPYEYNNGDLQSCVQFLEKHLYNGPISWTTFQYMVSAVQYGGKITDSLDVRLFRIYSEEWLQENTCTESFSFNPSVPLLKSPLAFHYKVPSFTELVDFRKFIESFPEIDSPEIFGLHPNADLTYRVKEAIALFSTLSETQPSGGGNDGGLMRDEIVYDKCSELLQRLPKDYIEDEYKANIKKLGGMGVPINIFLVQEVQRLQAVIDKVRFTLTQLQFAIKGEVIMTAELKETMDSIYDAKVPYLWENTLTGDEFSWRLPTLGLWFTSLLNRDDQYRSWLEHGRPNSIWLTGFFNPSGCLTAMKQEVTRKHRSEKWSLDDVVYHTEVTTFERVDQIKSPPAEGLYVHGLYLDGAGWNRQDRQLVESQPKVLFAPLPILYITGKSRKEEEKSRRELFGACGPYECPVYKYPCRTDRYLLFFATLKGSSDSHPNKWALRGTALLCNTA